MLRTFFALALSLALARCALANVESLAGGSDVALLSPHVEKTITLASEELTIRISQTEAQVEARFWLRNRSASRAVRKVGFPLGMAGRSGSGLVLKPRDFRVVSNGTSVKTQLAEGSALASKYKLQQVFDHYRVWDLTFAPNETKELVVSYRQPLFRDLYLGPTAEREFFYILTTGKSWAGPIGNFQVAVRWEDVQPWQRQALTFPARKGARPYFRDRYTVDLQAGQEVRSAEAWEPEQDISITLLARLGTRNPIPELEKEVQQLRQKLHQGVLQISGFGNWYLLGNLYYDLGKRDEAVAAFRKATEPGLSGWEGPEGGWTALGLVNEQEGQIQSALDCYLKARNEARRGKRQESLTLRNALQRLEYGRAGRRGGRIQMGSGSLARTAACLNTPVLSSYPSPVDPARREPRELKAVDRYFGRF